MIMLIDTHAHVNFKAFENDAKEVLQRALDSGVNVVNVGTQLDTSRQCVELAHQFPSGVYAVVGLHPVHTYSQYVDEEETHFKTREEIFDYEAYKKIALDSKVVGIGECGLDYFRLPADGDISSIKEKQKAAFRAQIKLAKELNKALVIHSRPAKDTEEMYDEMLEILDQELTPTTPSANASTPPMQGGEAPQLSQQNRGASPPAKGEHLATPSTRAKPEPEALKRGEGVGADARFEVHSFTGSPSALQKFIDRGAYVSFNGITTFDKTGNMEKLVQMTPLDKLILETDCPYLTPVPHRGKRNEPSFVKHTAEKVAQIKKISIEDIASLTTANAKKLFLV